MRIEFREEKTVFGAIAPRGPHAQDRAVQDGFRIAQQNCYRCHNSGREGGQKRAVRGSRSARWRQRSPKDFAAYIRAPLAKNPQAQMPGNPQYDDATLAALTAYFQTFSKRRKTLTLRTIKTLLVFGVAIFYSLVVFNNITDYDSNYQFVRHVMMMDDTFPGNRGMWRAINSPLLHTAFYLSIIAWESITMLLCWWGGFRMVRRFVERRRLSSGQAHFHRCLTLSLLMWLVAFLSVGAEWFLMWQSRTWNGQDPAFRMFAVVGIVLMIVMQPDRDDQP